jgi:hypothetical protein
MLTRTVHDTFSSVALAHVRTHVVVALFECTAIERAMH